MLEDPAGMDHKKISRANPSGPASSASDQRLNSKQDVTTHPKSGRPPRFSEPGNSQRRSNTQDYSSYNEPRGNVRRGQIKKPFSKTPGYKNANGTTNNLEYNLQQTMTMADEFEVGSCYNQGSKKQNLNHLLNFNYTPRSSMTTSHGRGSRPYRPHSDASKRRPKYKKEHYLQANCQFIVKDSANYDAHLLDPDMIVEWDLIEQVNLRTTTDVPSCPICLYPPTAAKISRCGHVFCWACILHYLSLSDSSWRKCPICDESIQRADLKSVVSTAWTEFKVGDEIEFYLMRRERNSLFALPVDAYFSGVNDKHPNLGMSMGHSRIVTASPSQVAQHVMARERQELENQFRADQNEPEVCFVEEALQYINEQEKDFALVSSIDEQVCLKRGMEWIKEMEADENETSVVDGCNNTSDVQNFLDSVDGERPRIESGSSDGAGFEESGVTVDDLDFSPIEDNSNGIEKSGAAGPKSTFYFYQSSDGQQIFLHAINVQMLSYQYGSLENCPRVIRGRILEKESTSMTFELRNKLRYLKHLPVTSVFEVCEIEFRIPKIAKEVWGEFHAQLEARQKRRQQRARDEKRRDKKIQQELDKNLLGKLPDPKLRIESNYHFPDIALATEKSFDSNTPLQEEIKSSELAEASTSKPLSFAKMLREGSSGKNQGWRAPFVASALPPPLPLNNTPGDEDYLPPPSATSIGDMLAQALEISSQQDPDAKNGAQKKKGKKMRGKIVNLTGGGARMSLN